jgi:hypothetical protein
VLRLRGLGSNAIEAGANQFMREDIGSGQRDRRLAQPLEDQLILLGQSFNREASAGQGSLKRQLSRP